MHNSKGQIKNTFISEYKKLKKYYLNDAEKYRL